MRAGADKAARAASAGSEQHGDPETYGMSVDESLSQERCIRENGWSVRAHEQLGGAR